MKETTIIQPTKTKLMNSLLSILLAVITAGGVGFGFYYNTNNKLSTHDEQIKTLEVNVKSLQEAINQNNVTLAIQSTELKHISESVDKIEKGQIEIIKLLKH